MNIFGTQAHFLPHKSGEEMQYINIPGFDDPFLYRENSGSKNLARFVVGRRLPGGNPVKIHFGIVCYNEETNNVFHSAKLGILTYTDPFLSRDQKEFKPLLEQLVQGYFKQTNFKFVSAVIGSTQPISKTQSLSNREIGVLTNFFQRYYFDKHTSFNGITCLDLSERVGEYGVEDQVQKHYLPKAWSLKDMASWVLTCQRLPNLKESRKLQMRNKDHVYECSTVNSPTTKRR